MSHTSPLGPGVFDVDALLAFHRATFGGARMETPPAPPAPPAPAPPEPKMYTQEQLNGIVARNEAKAADKAIAEKFGGKSLDEVASIYAAALDKERQAMTEADRKTAEAADAKAAADRQTAAAAQETLTAKVTQALLVSGIDLGGKDAKDEERAERLSMAARLVNVAPGADDAAIKAAIDRVKTTVPQLFDEPQGNGGGGQGDPGRGPNGRQQQPGAFGKDGDTEYAKRFPSKVAQPA